MELGLEGKAALVTASSTGIGLAVARELAREGARVLLTARRREELEEAVGRIREEGGTADLQVGDVTREESCQAMVEACAERFGSLDVVFTNAGGPPGGTFATIEAEQYREALELNLLSVVHLCRAAVPLMQRQHWGRIVALTSVSIKQPLDGVLLSNTARAGAQGFLKTLSREVAADGITVNTVCPGFTATERLQELGENIAQRRGITLDEVRSEWIASIPAQRIGDPGEIAALVAFLASERASYLTGTTIAVDGGFTRGLL